MRRRDVLKLSTGAAMLAAPYIARAQNQRTLRFVPTPDLNAIDPIFNANRATHTHAYLVFDTLYGLDKDFVARPQMVEGHTVENDGTLWTLRLREGLRFHDGTPVLARDAAASIRRFAARDGFGQSLMAVTSELSSPDDRTLRFRLTKPFPHLPVALAGSSPITPCIVPERLANTDPFRAMPEIVGSGPYRFVAAEFNMGARAAYERFAGYVPRDEGLASYKAGPKLTHFDRVEWQSLGDPATSAAALLRNEVDWLELAQPDLRSLLARDPGVTVEVTEPTGAIAVMRFNQLHPPFNNPDIRRAILGAIDQAEVMNAVSGTDPGFWHDGVGLFDPCSPLANAAGIEVLTAPRDYGKVKRDLAAAGYRGERVVVLGAAGNSSIPLISQVGTEALRKAGLNVDAQVTDAGTMFRRWQNRETPDKGGWNVVFSILDGVVIATPVTNPAIRGDGKSGWPGWPESPRFEALRDAWLDAGDLAAEKRIGQEMQLQLWKDVPYIPMGHWVRSTAHRRNIVDLPWGFAAFYGVRRV